MITKKKIQIADSKKEILLLAPIKNSQVLVALHLLTGYPDNLITVYRSPDYPDYQITRLPDNLITDHR